MPACNYCGGVCTYLLVPVKVPPAAQVARDILAGALRPRGLGLGKVDWDVPVKQRFFRNAQATVGWLVLLLGGIAFAQISRSRVGLQLVGGLWLAQYLYWTAVDASAGIDGPSPVLIGLRQLKRAGSALFAAFCALMLGILPVALAFRFHLRHYLFPLAVLAVVWGLAVVVRTVGGTTLGRLVNPATSVKLYREATLPMLLLLGGVLFVAAFHGFAFLLFKRHLRFPVLAITGIARFYLDVTLARAFGVMILYKAYLLESREDLLVPALGAQQPVGAGADEEERLKEIDLELPAPPESPALRRPPSHLTPETGRFLNGGKRPLFYYSPPGRSPMTFGVGDVFERDWVVDGIDRIAVHLHAKANDEQALMYFSEIEIDLSHGDTNPAVKRPASSSGEAPPPPAARARPVREGPIPDLYFGESRLTTDILSAKTATGIEVPAGSSDEFVVEHVVAKAGKRK
jgi:hypothetical protein